METLRLLRTSKGISMKALGQEIGISESAISLYETGKRSPDISTVILLADYFNVTVDYLVGHEKKADVQNGGLSKEDEMLVYAYHQASEEDRQIIDNIVKRYIPSLPSQENVQIG